MALINYHEHYDLAESLENFLDLHYGRKMHYFASDLLEKGFTAAQLVVAIRRAMVAGKTAGLEPRKHFQLTYTQGEGGLMKDCKLSALGYALLLLNAPAEVPAVGNFQLDILRKIGYRF